MAEVKLFTRAEVAQNSGKAGAPTWLIYKDAVYDVTTYMNEHPGGREEIVAVAGADGTKAFDGSGHSADARAVMKKYKIGEIVEEEKYYDANGKKKKRVVSAEPDGDSRSCLSVVTCGLLG